MKKSLRALRGRVSRRIFLLFFLAAFAPIAIISVVSYKHINQQMTDDVVRQLHQEARALGLAVYDRLTTLQTVLDSLAVQISADKISVEYWSRDSLQRMFDAISLEYTDGSTEALLGVAPPAPAFSENERKFLSRGNTVVATVANGSSRHVVLARYLPDASGGGLSRNLLLARPNREYLWNFGIYKPEIACALTSGREILNCSSLKLGRLMADSLDGNDLEKRLVSWEDDNNSYMLYVWDIFLGAKFGSDDIGIMLALPRRYSLNDIHSFNTIFPKSLLLTGLLVLFLSISQIRKNLDPLEQLIHGTKRISEGEYRNPVNIKSNDEFEELGDSFNEMAYRIDEQIKTLRMMSEIDRMILSSLDSEYITGVLIDYCHRLYPVDHVAVINVSDEEKSNNIITYNVDRDFREKYSEWIDEASLQSLGNDDDRDYYYIDASADLDFLKYLIEKGDTYFMVLPFRVKSRLTGVLIFGNSREFEVEKPKLEQLRELADRVAVALTNAAWEVKLYQQAHYDALTGLPNRYLFKDRLEQAVAWSERGKGMVALLLIDLDRFKRVNDSLGHTVGDELLVQVARRLSSCVRATDTLSRFGGDEFVIIFIGDTRHEDIYTQTSRLSSRLQNMFKQPFEMKGRELFITPSIGIATCPGDSVDVEDLLKYADNAMYQAKSEGRGEFRFYNQVHNKDMLMKLDLEADLRHALDRKEFHLSFQPKYSCKSGRISGAEALLRWEHPRWGNVDPTEFIPISEETGLIIDVGEWVLRSACEQTMDWLNRGVADISIAVNLSGEQFRYSGIASTVEKILHETGLPPARLELEITENIAIQDLDQTVVILKNLHSLGVSISMDDFGTGYSSMSYLQQFDIDRLKIDKSFVSKIPENSQSVSIARAIIALAHSLGLSVTAEGIETQRQFDFMLQSGIDELQGFYFSHPLAPGDFERFSIGHGRKNYRSA